jgi:hypothetical protein
VGEDGELVAAFKLINDTITKMKINKYLNILTALQNK